MISEIHRSFSPKLKQRGKELYGAVAMKTRLGAQGRGGPRGLYLSLNQLGQHIILCSKTVHSSCHVGNIIMRNRIRCYLNRITKFESRMSNFIIRDARWAFEQILECYMDFFQNMVVVCRWEVVTFVLGSTASIHFCSDAQEIRFTGYICAFVTVWMRNFLWQ